jgi:hypothetical protein
LQIIFKRKKIKKIKKERKIKKIKERKKKNKRGHKRKWIKPHAIIMTWFNHGQVLLNLC